MACEACSEPLIAGARFCMACGAAVPAALQPPAGTAPPVVPTGERRVCSVLFCDLVGWTPIAESLDAEEARELLLHYFDAARLVVLRYGGVVEKFIGDAVVAVWGAPTAVEGGPELAVRAALDLIDSVDGLQPRGRSLVARAGVVTGEVAIVFGAEGQGLVAGDTVNTAARVQAVATPGKVFVDEDTWRLTRQAIGFSAQGAHPLKGKREPTRLWQAEAVLAGFGGVRAEGAPGFIGRGTELRLIKELFHACAEASAPRLVSVTGVAGVGKSRLSQEFEKYTDGLPGTVLWHSGRCESYGDGGAFAPLVAMVRKRLGLSDDDVPDAQQMASRLSRWLPDPADREYVVPRLARLIGAGSDTTAPDRREELFAGWRVFFERLALIAPVILVVEDLDRGDASLFDFLEHLLDWSREVPIFLLTLGRTEVQTRRPGWGLRRNATTLDLGPFDRTSMDALLEALVPGVPEVTRRAIAARAEGVPLYAVETVRMLVDRGVVREVDGRRELVGDVGELSVPPTLQSLLAARLDGLDRDCRAVVADAAVLGQSFPLDALVAVSGHPNAEISTLVNELVHRSILTVRADPLAPDRGQYAFVQTMFRQVAYQVQPRAERKTRHLAVARHFERLAAQTSEDFSEVAAAHLLAAFEVLPGDPDAGQIRQRAVEMLRRAGDSATRTGAHSRAATVYATAADLLSAAGGGESRGAAAYLCEQAGHACGAAGDEQGAVEAFEHAAAAFRAGGQLPDAARAEAWAGEHLRRQGRQDQARRLLEPAVAVLEQQPDEHTVAALEHLAMLEILQGGPAGERLSAAALSYAEVLGLTGDAVAELFITRSTWQTFTGITLQASASLREAVRLAEAAGNDRVATRALANLAETLFLSDLSEAQAAARAAVAHGKRVGDTYLLGFAEACLVEALLLRGELAESDDVLDDAINGDGFTDDPLVAYTGMVLRHAQGDFAAVLQFLTKIEIWAASEDLQDRTYLLTGRSIAALVRGDPTTALEHAEEALEVATPIGVIPARWAWSAAADAALVTRDQSAAERLVERLDRLPAGHLGARMRGERARVRGWLAAERCEDETAAAEFGLAERELQEFGSPYFLARALLDQAGQLIRGGSVDQGRTLAERARGLAEDIGAGALRRHATRLIGDATSAARAALAVTAD